MAGLWIERKMALTALISSILSAWAPELKGFERMSDVKPPTALNRSISFGNAEKFRRNQNENKTLI